MGIALTILTISIIVAVLSLIAVIVGLLISNDPLAIGSGYILEISLSIIVFYGLVWLGNEIIKVLN